jgi:hypothetical protein
MAKKQNPEPINTGTTKYEVVVDGDDIIQIWKYDNYKSVSSPYEVETKYKKPEKKG